jgi:hypothetical protein
VRERPPPRTPPRHLDAPDPAARSGLPVPARWRNWGFHWGSAYHLAVIDGLWTARRRDRKGGTLTDPTPAGLRLQILADYAAMPVPRDLP